MPLYAGYRGFWSQIPMHALAALVDVGMGLLVMRLAFRRGRLSYPVLFLGGILLAVAVELIALRLGWWSYTAAMPMLPVARVGLTPVLQMAALPGLAILICRRLSQPGNQILLRKGGKW